MKKITIFLIIILPLLIKSQDKLIENNKDLDKYFSAGIPTLNKNWTPEEFVNSSKILVSEAENNRLSLPSKKDNSIEILEKFTNFDTQNYWFLLSDDISEQEKFFYTMDVTTAIRQLCSIYYKKNKSINGVYNYSYELCSLNAALIKLMDEMLILTDDFIAEHPNLTDIQKEGLQKMKLGLNTFISGDFMIIKDEFKNYNELDICKISEVFFDFYYNNRTRIDEVSRKEFDTKLLDIQQNHNSECVKKASLKDYNHIDIKAIN